MLGVLRPRSAAVMVRAFAELEAADAAAAAAAADGSP